MTFNFLGPGLTVNVEAKVKEQIILDSSDFFYKKTLTHHLVKTRLKLRILQMGA